MKRILSILCLIFWFLTGYLNSQTLSFNSKGIGGGGALFFPTINPANENEFYVSCDMSELFHTSDFGQTYNQVHFSKLQVFNTSTYEYTAMSNLAYCVHNDGNNGYPVITRNGGNLWKTITAYNISTYGKVYALKANYNNPAQLIIAAYGDILFSNDTGASFSLVKHATNNGAGITMGGVLWDGPKIYIGTNEGVYYSVNSGSSFSLLPTTGIPVGQVIWSFAGARSGNTVRLACITANNADVYNGLMPWDYNSFAKGVYTMDAIGTWVSKSTGINFLNDYVMYMAMADNDINTIYLGGHDNALSAPLVYKSADGGNTWTKKFNTTNNSNIVTGWEGANGDKSWSWSETCFGISVAKDNSNRIVFGGYSNVQVSSDGGNNWKQAYINSSDEHAAGIATPVKKSYHSIGLENTTCWQVYWQDINSMMGCFSDIGGIRSLDAGNTWGFQYNGFSVNSLYRMAKGSDGTMYGACSGIHDLYQSTRLQDSRLDANDGSGKIVYSKDNGANWANLHVFNHPVYWVALDPNKPNRMYAAVVHFGGTQGNQLGGIYICNDLNNLATSTWTKLSNPPRTEGHPSNIIVLNDGKALCTFSGRRTAAGAFTASSGVFLYDPAQNSWTDLSHAGMNYWTQDIVLDPSDATQSTWYACVYSGWGGAPNGLGGLYKTVNRGGSWTKITASQFNTVTSITFNPKDANQAFLSTEMQGLWVSVNMNDNTPVWNLVNTYPFRQAQRMFFNPYNTDELWVSSFGNGMKVANIKGTSIANFIPSKKENIFIFPNPNQGIFTIKFQNEAKRNIKIFDLSGQLVMQTEMTGCESIVDSTNLISGLYWVQAIDAHGITIQCKFIIN